MTGAAPCDHPAILALFASRRYTDRDSAIAQAWEDPHVDTLLAGMIDAPPDRDFKKPMVAALLGDLDGSEGDAALRRAIKVSGPGTRDLRCASLLSLAKRLGEKATPDLVLGLASRDWAVKDYALIGLSGTGGAGAYDDVVDWLTGALRRAKPAGEPPESVPYALAYLAQHVDDSDRRTGLVRLIRENAPLIQADAWLSGLWPEVLPGGPEPEAVPAPDGRRFRDWARACDGLFAPLDPALFSLPITSRPSKADRRTSPARR